MYISLEKGGREMREGDEEGREGALVRVIARKRVIVVLSTSWPLLPPTEYWRTRN
jgi:hypothetical protein